MKLAVDFGPLLVFFVSSKFAGGPNALFIATGAFMVATVVAIAVSLAVTRRVAPMLIFTSLIVLVFGGLTLWLQDKTFIKLKPTLIYCSFAGVLLFGMATGRNYLKLVLHEALPALDNRGWAKLTRNWALFFLALAGANEVARRLLTDDQWVNFKVWGMTGAVFVFALAQASILNRHAAKPES